MEQAATVTVSEGWTLSLFAYFLLVVIAFLAAVLIRGIVLALQGMRKTREHPLTPATPVQVAVAPGPAGLEDKAAHVAAIAAAIYTVVGAHRLIYVGEAHPSYSWTTTGRMFHQTSHAPKRAPRR